MQNADIKSCGLYAAVVKLLSNLIDILSQKPRAISFPGKRCNYQTTTGKK